MDSKEKKKPNPPKLNKFMHPRNPYRTPPSFKKLATTYPEFRAHCTYDVGGKVHLDFKNPKALRALTTCLLDQDFGLKVSIPEDRLVPTLPLRFNYLLWVQDLLTHAAHFNQHHVVVGVDIGAGASCVYPLLASRKLGWKMLATETDPINYDAAAANVSNNNLLDHILVKKVEESTIFKGVLDDLEVEKHMFTLRSKARETSDSESEENKESTTTTTQETATTDLASSTGLGSNGSAGGDDSSDNFVFDFTMSNPPFFSCEEETNSMMKSKKTRGEPVSAPTGALHEKVTAGGEVALITQMVQESQHLGNKVRLFTTLIGSKSHVKEVKSVLTAAKPKSYVVTEFCQGRTMRWGVAWTFTEGIELNQVRSRKEIVSNKPMVLMIPRSLVSVYSVPAVWNLVLSWLRTLKVKVRVFKTSKYFVSANIKAFKVTWLHTRRKKREEKRKEDKSNNAKEENEDKLSSNKNSGGCLKRKLENETSESKMETDEEEDAVKKLKIDEAQNDSDELEDTEEEGEDATSKMRVDALDDEQPSDNEVDDEVEMLHGGKRATNELGEECGDTVDKEDLQKMKNFDKFMSEDDLLNSEPGRKKKGFVFKSGHTDNPQNVGNKSSYILRSNFQVKQTGSLISLEAFYLDGSSGKDGLNQMLQFMRNQLTNPFSR